ncbi:MAG: adenylate/guanylate cyclase domain-containing protein [Azospirillaceae bacterium]
MFRLRYYLAMASIIVVDAAITLVFAALTGRPEILPRAAVANLAVLGGLNLLGAWWLYRPVAAWLSGKGSAAAAARRLGGLPRRSAAWVVFVALVYGVTVFLMGIFTPDLVQLAELEIRVAMLVWFLLVYAGYMCFVAFFAVSDVTASLRAEMFVRDGVTVRGPQVRILYRLVLVFAVVTIVPVLLVLLDLGWFTEVRRLQGLSVEETVLLDLTGALVAAALSLVFVTRGLVRPVDRLVEAAARVGAGDYAHAKVPPMGDDELGVLSRAFNRMVDGLVERAYVRETFGKYVSEAVAERILATGGGRAAGSPPAPRPDREAGRLDGDVGHATVMFVDLETFTALAESLAPDAVLDLLNEYLAAIAGPIERHGGAINNFIGDAVLVTFNLPAGDPDHAGRAVACARDILALLERRRFSGDRRLRVRIGINTGTVVAGSVGPADRMAFTVLGDAVNLAARLESLNKEYGTRLLVGPETARAAADRFAFARLGTAPVRGRAETVELFGLAEEAPSPAPDPGAGHPVGTGGPAAVRQA